MRFAEVNQITGIPTETTDSDTEHLGYLWFTPELPTTFVSFGSRLCDGKHDHCFEISDITSSSAYGCDGFRPFRGKIPEIVIEGA
jgi:hypothetical protein